MPTEVATIEKKPRPGARDRLNELFGRIYFIFHLTWIHLCVVIWNYWYATGGVSSTSSSSSSSSPLRPTLSAKGAKPKKKTHKFLHVGDDVALGIGDWVNFLMPTGLVHYINLQQPLLISNWVSAIEGRAGSTTEDWVPSGLYFESCFNLNLTEQEGANSRGFFGRLLQSNHNHLDADIVMISVGYNDTCEPATTASNIVRMYAAIRERLVNKDAVVIVNIPPIPHAILERGDDSAVKHRVLKRNEAIRQALIRLEYSERSLRAMRQAEATRSMGVDPVIIAGPAPSFQQLASVAHGPLRVGIDLHQMLMNRGPEEFILRGLHMRPRVYKEAARTLDPVVLLAQKTVEAGEMRRMMETGRK